MSTSTAAAIVPEGKAAAAAARAGTITKILSILSAKEKRQLALLVPMVVLMALLETAGVASIVPFLGLLSDEHALERSATLSWANEALGFRSRERFFFAVGLGVLGTFIVSNVMSALTTWRLISFTTMRAHDLSVRLLESYLRQPWAFFLGKNTADLSKNILSEVQTVVSGVLGQLVNLSSRLVVIAAILTMLVALDPKMALGVLVVFGGVYGGIYTALRKRATLRGRERVRLNQERFKIAQEALGGAKELKLYGLEPVAVREFSRVSHRFAQLVAENAVSVQLPRYAIETIAFGGVLVMVLVWLGDKKPLEELLPVLGLYAFAAYRLLPSLQTMFASFNALRFNLASLDAVVDDLRSRAAIDALAPRPAVEPCAFKVELALEAVSFRYEGATRQTLDAITLTQKPGEWLAIVGPTGAGKSTLVDLMLGVLAPNSGRVLVDGVPLDSEERRAAWQGNCAYVPQHIFLVDDTALRNIAFGVPDSQIDRGRVEWAARIAQIHEFIAGELRDGYDTVIGERGMRLSGGQRQRIGIARALYRQPRYLVLDEATSALDGETESRFFAALQSALETASVVSIAHRLSTTRSADRIFVVSNGSFVETGTFEQMSSEGEFFRESIDQEHAQ